ncbi:MAG: hypothetical protein LUO95_03795 [Methylococcaceae bacterium]|nr:hypothetical protein [Methylococcaceae bacterium]
MAEKMLKEIIKGSERKFGRASIFIAFAVISLIAAFVLFKFFNSTGIMTIVFPDNQGKAERRANDTINVIFRTYRTA